MATSRAGTARVDITPDWPVMMAGFGQRTQPSQGVLDRIFVKALFLDDGENRLLLITADLISTPRPLRMASRARTFWSPIGVPDWKVNIVAPPISFAVQPMSVSPTKSAKSRRVSATAVSAYLPGAPTRPSAAGSITCATPAARWRWE